MPLAAIGTPWWIAIAGILIFLLLMVLRFALALIREVKGLAEGVRDATERLQDALAEVEAESRLAAERAERLQEGLPARRRR